MADRAEFYWDGTRLAEQTSIGADGIRQTTTWDYRPDSWTALTQVELTATAAMPDTAEGARTPGGSAELSAGETDRRFYAVVTDLIGTPTELVDEEGRIAWRRRATVWGDGYGPAPPTSPDAGTPDCPLRFPGQYHDAETGWDYNYHRYYDPAIGRYASPDPLGLAPSPDDHGYVSNPCVEIDPLGLTPDCEREGTVDYGSTDLSRAAFDYRMANKITPGQNVAVYEYRDGNNDLRLLYAANTPGGDHSETKLNRQIQQMGVDPSSVTRIYSERVPCTTQ